MKKKRNDLYIFNETDSAYKVIKSIMLDFFITGFQSSNYIMNGQFCPESEEEVDYVLECLRSDFEAYFATNFSVIIREINMRAKHLAKLDLKKNYFKQLREIDQINEINEDGMKNKFIAMCPKCKKKINSINFDASQIKKYPFSYINIHSSKDCSEHALLLYIDAQGKCRGKGIIDFLRIEKH
ncbi:MAG: hypothetical protein JW891_18005 [Candidatus Lokiarchaeota archaeon]|nr:hypothetical protein [Candidatus Lokiarchaeota archaeon]